MQQSFRQQQTLLIAGGQTFDEDALAASEICQFANVANSMFAFRFGQIIHASEEVEVLFDCDVSRAAEFRWHETEFPAHTARIFMNRVTFDQHVARVSLRQRRHDSQQRRFPGTIRSDEPQCGAARHGETHLIHGDQVIVRLRHIDDFNRRNQDGTLLITIRRLNAVDTWQRMQRHSSAISSPSPTESWRIPEVCHFAPAFSRESASHPPIR